MSRMKEELYEDWYSDHKTGLMEEWIEENTDEWFKFCKDKFDEWLKNR